MTAKALCSMPSALVAELNTGKTIAAVAQTKGVALDKIVTAFVQPHVDWLNQAVKDGKITQTRADQSIATMKANITTKLSAPFTPRGNGDGVCDVADRLRRVVKVCAARTVKVAAWDAGIDKLIPRSPLPK